MADDGVQRPAGSSVLIAVSGMLLAETDAAGPSGQSKFGSEVAQTSFFLGAGGSSSFANFASRRPTCC